MQADISMKTGTSGGNHQPSVAVVRQADATPAPEQVKATEPVKAAEQTLPATGEELSQAVDDLNMMVQSFQRNLNFSVDEGSGKTIVKVIDSQSDEVIRQIPSEEVVALARRLRETSNEALSGLLMRSQA